MRPNARDYLQSLDRDTRIINAGCGKGQHPTQAALDIVTINKELGRTQDLRLLIAGDLARGRTARSLAYLMGRQPGVSIDFVSPAELAMGHDMLAYLKRHNTPYRQLHSLDDAIAEADVVYMTRVQKERPLEGVSLSQLDIDCFKLTVKRAQRMKPGSCIMHPMPIVDEIEEGVERMVHAAYFRQSDNGVPVRMALLDMMMS